MEKKKINLLANLAEYYSNKLLEHGETAKGVDWNGQESQILRFSQLTKLVENIQPFSLNDVGCGYGALFEFLEKSHPHFKYYGCDISGDMINAATVRYNHNNNAHFIVSSIPETIADYTVASGIFNVRLEHGDIEWKTYLIETLDSLHESSKRGFAFNCLTSYSDVDKMRDYLYYADPCWLFDLCKKHYSRNVALLHDYDLYEFTILVRK